MGLCSVIVPAYNVQAYIVEAVESALSQTYPEVEVVVVNDGSTDGTARVLKPLRNKITYVEQPNLGPSAARNRGLREARGEFIALLDGDDIMFPRRLERVIGLLDEHPQFGFATSDAYFLHDGVASEIPHNAELPGGFRAEDQPYWILDYNFVFGMVVIRRELFDVHGAFDETLRTCEDWDLWIRFILGGERVGLVAEPLAYYRRRDESLTRDWSQIIGDALTVIERTLDRTDTRAIPRLGTTIYKRGLQALALGDIRRCRRFFWATARDRTSAFSLRAKAAALALLPELGRFLYRRRRPTAFEAVTRAGTPQA
jgi:glycosyltransferase involved in cell wall biosynthesis